MTQNQLAEKHGKQTRIIKIETPKRIFSCNLVYSGALKGLNFQETNNCCFLNVFKGFQVCSGIKNRLPIGSRNCCVFISLRTGVRDGRL